MGRVSDLVQIPAPQEPENAREPQPIKLASKAPKVVILGAQQLIAQPATNVRMALASNPARTPAAAEQKNVPVPIPIKLA